MTAFAGFDRIRIINLPSRKDRRAQTVSELRRLDLDTDPRVEFAEGVLVNDMKPFRAPGEKGVFLAHLKILTEAANADESVLILEDDVDFVAGAERWARPADVDIAYGGYEAVNPNDLEASDLYGAHCIGFSAAAAKALVPYLNGLLTHESPPPVDGAYVWFRRVFKEFNTAFAVPVIAVQRPSRSDITPGHRMDSVAALRPAMNALRQIKRAIQRGEMTFGIREAIAVAILSVAITIAAAIHYGT